MADEAIVHIGENSPEQVAYRLFETIATVESKTTNDMDRDYILSTYVDCIKAVKHQIKPPSAPPADGFRSKAGQALVDGPPAKLG